MNNDFENEGINNAPLTPGVQQNNNSSLSSDIANTCYTYQAVSPTQQGIANIPPTYVAKAKPAFTANKIDIIFVFAVFALSYFFIDKLFLHQLDFNFFIFTVLFNTLGILYLLLKNKPLCKTGFIYIGLSILMALPTLLYCDIGYYFLNVFFTALLATYGFTVLCNIRLQNELGKYFSKDIFNSLIYRPFLNFAASFCVFGSALKQKRKNKMTFAYIGGALLSVILVAVVVNLLSGADETFGNAVNCIFAWFASFFNVEIEYIFLRLFLTVPTFMYLFGLFYGGVNNRYAQKRSVFLYEQLAEGKKNAPSAIFLIPFCSLICVFVTFFATHCFTLYDVFAGGKVLYSQYARSGFFELCWVSAINLLLVLAAKAFCGKKNFSPALKTCTAILCTATLGLLFTATAKLLLYIYYYGLTPKRIYAAWAILVIAVLFVAMVIALYKKINITKIAGSFIVISLLILSLSGIGNLCAKYNMAQFENGNLPDFSYEDFESYQISAVPAMIQQYNVTSNSSKKLILKKQLYKTRYYNTYLQNSDCFCLEKMYCTNALNALNFKADEFDYLDIYVY